MEQTPSQSSPPVSDLDDPESQDFFQLMEMNSAMSNQTGGNHRQSITTISSSDTNLPYQNAQGIQILEQEPRIVSDNGEAHSQNKTDRTWHAKPMVTWLWETSGILLSIGCMASVFAILPFLNNASLSHWQFAMAPNTMISTFITITKTSMLLVLAEEISQLKWRHFENSWHTIEELDYFDGASRGPFGSFMFLCYRTRRAIIASLGAVITILALAMEPFGQQIISFETRYVVRPEQLGKASMAYAYDHFYTAEDRKDASANYDPAMQLAAVSGLVGFDTSVPFTCSSGNCTWPTYTSLGLCSYCANKTEQTVLSKCGIEAVRSPPWPYCIAEIFSNGTRNSNCTQLPPRPGPGETLELEIFHLYETPGQVSFGTSVYYELNSTDSKGLMDDADSRIIASGPIGLDHLSVIDVRLKGITKSGQDLDVCASRISSLIECQLKWCVKVYENLEINGTVHSLIVHDLPLSSTDGNATLSLDEIYEDLPRTLIFSLNTTEPDSQVPEPSHFEVDKRSLKSMWRMLGGMFQVRGLSTDFDDNIVNIVLWDNDLTSILPNITEGITNRIRTGYNTTSAIGTAYYPETCVVVRWEWVILPASLVLLCSLFFVLMVHRNSKQSTPLWKSSLLPLLFHGLQGWNNSELRAEDKLAMEAAAKRMDVQLFRNEEGDRRLMRRPASFGDEDD